MLTLAVLILTGIVSVFLYSLWKLSKTVERVARQIEEAGEEMSAFAGEVRRNVGLKHLSILAGVASRIIFSIMRRKKKKRTNAD
ncbi:MAG: hypothetical protein COV07_02200 [Candidatus Vogelbacteria bacterium CG10_big_fil_rev_8_21_14_0_10_45_14]|uniref:DUF948 domain-containing protein n=1 Tax=Candidatus Vogelbacteria bacterium CG10_big_fil_rev_8_21_14_0_10_45_14 TaxID=1975042 RepID=A0A2H0RK35_9BACT|nr:MAG: hypothetical protein COV07_02200 [Candidatus Vogelbacteria bacterium CG10_big_fil_rev_8_21_14_0_10_45_14]